VQIAHGTHVPIVLLGGERTDSLAALFESIARAMDLGASGVAMGRNIWGQDNPREILEAVVGLVHGGWDIQKVMAHCHHTH
jgi:DhnA family fructose-bisphosphate aldolase class Ia